MPRRLAKAASTIFAAVMAAVAPALAQAPQSGELLVVATGPHGGIYHPLGSSVCRLLNRAPAGTGPLCYADSTDGSVANVEALRRVEVHFAIIQSDVKHFALEGRAPFEEKGTFPELRTIFVAHAEAWTVIVPASSAIKRLEELPGKRVGVGLATSGQRATTDLLLKGLGWTRKSFAAFENMTPEDQIAAFCDGRVDAIVMKYGHPNGYVQKAAYECGVSFLPLEGPKAMSLLAKYPYYWPVVVPGDLYPGVAGETPTIGSRAAFVTTAGMPEDAVYALTRVVFEHLDTLKLLHPAFRDFRIEDMLPRGRSTPVHRGAARYFREKGLLP